ncbi:MAG: glycosyltransferase family 39 protein [Cyanobacteria bacterium J06592_8]
MKNKIILSQGFTIAILLCLLIGIGFRFFHLGHKVYWYDEVQTSFRISGYTQEEFFEKFYIGWPETVENLLNIYQYPTSERNLQDSFQALTQHPEHSPLYFLSARFWMQTFSHSITTIRSLSALISLLIFPAMYWLCWELFQSRSVSGMAIAFVAISPFHVLYAQEARAYSLWSVTILLSSAALLQALRVSQTQKSSQSQVLAWGIYALSVGLGLYSHLFSIFVCCGQGVYVFLTQQARQRRFIIPYLLSNFLGFLLFTPWLLIFVQNLDSFLENTESRLVPRPGLPLYWLLNLNRIFFDVNQGISLLNITLYFTLALSIYALYFLIKTTPQKTWLFILTLIGVPGMILILPDLILGGRGSTIARYAMPCYLGIQIAVAYLFTQKLTTVTRHKSRWKWGLYLLIFAGVLSCTVSSVYPVWWHKSYAKSRDIPIAAQVINQSPSPLIISDEEPGRIMSLLHQLKGNVKVQLMPESQVPVLPKLEEFSDVLLYRPTEKLIAGMEKIYNVQVEKPYPTPWVRKVEFPQ